MDVLMESPSMLRKGRERTRVLCIPLLGVLFAAPSLAVGRVSRGCTGDWADGSETMTVRIGVDFASSATTSGIQAAATKEAAAIWHAYGVELASFDAADATMKLDVRVERHTPTSSGDGPDAFRVLGRTTFDRAGVVHGPIRISLDRIESMLLARDAEHPWFSERQMGRAIGRVLAHELGHVLLGVPTYHERRGLMRAVLSADDMVLPARNGVQLSDGSVRRLHVHLAELSKARVEGCADGARVRVSPS
jgi:hypothetical protein